MKPEEGDPMMELKNMLGQRDGKNKFRLKPIKMETMMTALKNMANKLMKRMQRITKNLKRKKKQNLNKNV